VSALSVPYVSDDSDRGDFIVEGEGVKDDGSQAEYYNIVGRDFFQTLGIPILAGRGFDPRDTATSPKVGVINRALARQRFGNQNPIGKRFAMELDDSGHTPREWIEIVGVCADTRYSDLRTAPPPQYIVPLVQQSQVGFMAYAIRTSIEPMAAVPALRRALQQIDPNLPTSNNLRTQEQQIHAATQQERIFVTLTSGFGVLALLLASVGIYGIMAYSVAQRKNEIGIRLAMGAQRRQMRAMVLRESTLLTLAGVAAGIAVGLLLTRPVSSMLYGVPPDDPLTVGAGALLLLAIALAASWIPATRAARVEPIEALRHE
jgi:predicted permease